MSFWLLCVAGLAVVALPVLLLTRRARRRGNPPQRLEHFDFDRNKSYEREGRKFPFSY